MEKSSCHAETEQYWPKQSNRDHLEAQFKGMPFPGSFSTAWQDDRESANGMWEKSTQVSSLSTYEWNGCFSRWEGCTLISTPRIFSETLRSFLHELADLHLHQWDDSPHKALPESWLEEPGQKPGILVAEDELCRWQENPTCSKSSRPRAKYSAHCLT